MKANAILFDTRSIQRYIFSGNKLRTNIGASHIVDRLFEDILVKQVLKNDLQGQVDIEDTSWRNGGTPEQALQDHNTYVAYIGGGNALLLTTLDQSMCKQIVTTFTTKVLIKYPGLKTGAAVGQICTDTKESFQTDLNGMYQQLKENQNTVFPRVNVPYTGLTQVCEVNGEAANFYDTRGLIGKEQNQEIEYRFYSQEVASKARASEGANQHLQEMFQDIIGDYQFPKELNELGQIEGENDIAIVHIDGNQMGVKFQKCESLSDRSAMSEQVSNKTKNSFGKLLKKVVAERNSGVYDKVLKISGNHLPIRPLIIGGDDVTFVCPARVALQYARAFMKAMDTNTATTGDDSIKTCAGIAILNTNYPFFRGYELAEQLCDVAKAESRAINSCWVDFAILHGEQEPELEQIRRQEYAGALGDMHFGPYQVDKFVITAEDDEKTKKKKENAILNKSRYALDKLLDCAKAFNKMEGKRGKIKELRNVAQRGEHEILRYMEQLSDNKVKLPSIAGWEQYQDSVWAVSVKGADKETPYVDAVEMMDYVYDEGDK